MILYAGNICILFLFVVQLAKHLIKGFPQLALSSNRGEKVELKLNTRMKENREPL